MVGGNEVYQQQTSWPVVLEHSEVVVLWSANPLNNLKSPRMPRMSRGRLFCGVATKRQTPDLHDPMRSGKRRLLAIRWSGSPLLLWASTDAALMLGIAHTLVEKRLAGMKRSARCTTGYDRFADYLFGQDRRYGGQNKGMGGGNLRRFCGENPRTGGNISSSHHHVDGRLGNAASAVRRAKALDDRYAGRNAGAIVRLGGGFALSYHLLTTAEPDAPRRRVSLRCREASPAGSMR